MPRSSDNDRRYLEKHGDSWRVTLAVPRALRAKLGVTKLKRSLKTDSLAIANRLKWGVIAELKAEINKASTGRPRDPFDELALSLQAELREAETDDAYQRTQDMIGIVVNDLAGPEIGQYEDEQGRPQPLYDEERERVAIRVAKIAGGRLTPLRLHYDRYLSELQVKPRTKGDDNRIIDTLEKWCRSSGLGFDLQTFDRRITCIKFRDALGSLLPNTGPDRLNKYLHRLSRYWGWLEDRGEVPANVWKGIKVPVPKRSPEERRRPFSDDEMVRLLSMGETPQVMKDLMRIAALTGARLEAIVNLRIRDVQTDSADGKGPCFVFMPMKKEEGQRLCPIHPDLRDMVADRISGSRVEDGKPESGTGFRDLPTTGQASSGGVADKQESNSRFRDPSDWLLPELPRPGPGSQREQSWRASVAFTKYRRSCRVGALEGQWTDVDFHSFRRWFISKAEQAGQPESTIAAVVGHKRQGMTLGLYSSGPSISQARACIEAVRLPVTAA